MMVIDTVLLGHYHPDDLAAVAIGGGIYVSIVFALVGIVQAVSPLVAHAYGAKQEAEIGRILQQGVLLGLVIALPGIYLLKHPDFLFGLSKMTPSVEAKVRAYLATFAWGLPASVLYRTFYAFCNGLGRSRILMYFGLGSMACHAVLAWGLALQGWLGEPLGAVGCARSNIVLSWSLCIFAVWYLRHNPAWQHLHLLRTWHGIQWSYWRNILRLGVPMGLANFVEITAFTLVALFIAPLGADVVAGHRIVANLSALIYMLPLSLGVATLSAVARARGAHQHQEARRFMALGISFAVVCSTLLGGLLWLGKAQVVAWYTDVPAVQAIAGSLLIYLVAYQCFDALQTLAAHILRAYRITLVPMLMQVLSFWGVGLLGGWYFAYQQTPPLGAAGFWLGSVLSLILVAVLLSTLLWQVLRSEARN